MITVAALQDLTNQVFGFLEGVLGILSMYPLGISAIPFAILQGFSYT
jgi:hypothetical protein